ncbi:MAG TPA: hypothetical protein VGW10_13705 [Solirubrobacteraceae bacterium]|nr:hypothetical protein [Solirubrobacteraceae bacterium]
MILGALAAAGSASAAVERYVYCPDRGCVYGPRDSSGGPGHSTYYSNWGQTHYAGHWIGIREFDVGNGKRLYQTENDGWISIEHVKYRSYPSCINPEWNNYNSRFHTCSAQYAESSGERAGLEPQPCAGREWEYPDIALGQPTIATGMVEATADTKGVEPSAQVPNAPTADPAASVSSATHPDSDCFLGYPGSRATPARSTAAGDRVWTGRLADGIGCLVVARRDGTVLRGCGGQPGGQTAIRHAVGESKRGDLYALAPTGSNVVRFGRRTYKTVNGVAVASNVTASMLVRSSK